MKIYKLTDQNLRTYQGLQWTEGIWAPTLSGTGGLCGSGFYHAYPHPLLAEFLNPLHANFKNPILWEAEGQGAEENDNGLKLGFSEMRIVSRMELKNPTTIQRVSFALLCAKEVYKEASFVEFADRYLKGEDRSEKAARAARAAAWAAEAAARAAWAAQEAARAAARAARAAAWAAEAAARAAQEAARSTKNDFTNKLIWSAEEAMKIQ